MLWVWALGSIGAALLDGSREGPSLELRRTGLFYDPRTNTLVDQSGVHYDLQTHRRIAPNVGTR